MADNKMEVEISKQVRIKGREPLRTISEKKHQDYVPAPSGTTLDTRFLQIRKTYATDELDWNFKMFEDSPRPSLNDKEENTPKNSQSALDNLKKNRAYSVKAHAVAIGDFLYLDDLIFKQENEKKVVEGTPTSKMSRCQALNWMMKINGSTGNSPAIFQLACQVFDSFICKIWVRENRLRLIAAACYWIATKLHCCPVTITQIVDMSEDKITRDQLLTAEKYILTKQVDLNVVTPYNYIPYLAWCCDQSQAGLIEAAATFICQCGIIMDKSVNEEYASVVAVAAVKDVMFLLSKPTWIKGLKECPIFKEAAAKANHMSNTCTILRNAVRTMSSKDFEHNAAIIQFSGAPDEIAEKIVGALKLNFKA